MGKDLMPYGVYDTKQCGLAYIGLHEDEADVWKVWLGWPHPDDIEAAKRRGLRVLPVTVQYKPPGT